MRYDIWPSELADSMTLMSQRELMFNESKIAHVFDVLTDTIVLVSEYVL